MRDKTKRKKNQQRKQRLKATRRTAMTARRSIRFETISPDGVVQLSERGWWSVTLRLSDINYRLASNSEQKSVIDRWMSVIDQADDRSRLQLTVANRILDSAQAVCQVAVAARGDGLDRWRQAFNSLATHQLAHAGRRVVTDKYLTLSVQAEDVEDAKSALDRLERGIEDDLDTLGCKAQRLSRTELLRLIHGMLTPGDPFAWSEAAYADASRPKNMGVKDYIVPWSIDYHDKQPVEITGVDTYYQQHLEIDQWPAQLTDTLLADLSAIPEQVVVTVHLRPWDRAEGLEKVARTQTAVKVDYDRAVIQVQKQGLGTESVPDKIVDQVDSMTKLLEELRSSNERIIDTYVQVSVTALSPERLADAVEKVKQAGRRLSVRLATTRFFAPEAVNAMLPLGYNQMPISRALTTDSASILVPFTSQELIEKGGLLYGVNTRSSNPVIVNRATHMNANGFILGTTGSGKSQSAKAEIAQRVMRATDRVIIIDPEHEYEALANAMGGRILTISAGSSQHINPMDISFNADDTDPVRSKTSEVISLLGSLLGGETGLSTVAKSVIDRACMSLYTACSRQHDVAGTFRQPTLLDLRGEVKRLFLDGQDNPLPEAMELYTELEMFAKGSSAGFGQATNVDINQPFLVFDVSGLTGESRTFGMMTVLNAVWTLVREGRASGTRTWLYVDEFHTFFHNQYSITTFLDIYKRARKYGLGVTGITQNIDELLANSQARLMLSNADFLLLLNQKKTDADELKPLLSLSDQQMRLIENVKPGCGLINTAGASIGVDNTMDTTNPLYKLYSTTPGQNRVVESVHAGVGGE